MHTLFHYNFPIIILSFETMNDQVGRDYSIPSSVNLNVYWHAESGLQSTVHSLTCDIIMQGTYPSSAL